MAVISANNSLAVTLKSLTYLCCDGVNPPMAAPALAQHEISRKMASCSPMSCSRRCDIFFKVERAPLHFLKVLGVDSLKNLTESTEKVKKVITRRGVCF